MSERSIAIVAFAIYSIAYESLIWGIFAWAVFWQGRSPWWMLLAMIMSGAQLRKKDFGIH